VSLPPSISKLISQQRFDMATSEAVQLLEKAERKNGPTHPDTLTAVSALGGVLAYGQDYINAFLMFNRALEGREKAPEPDSREIDLSLCNLGYVGLETRNFHLALKRYQQVLDIRERSLPAGHPGIATAMTDVGYSYWCLGDLQNAEVMYSRAVEIAERELPRGSRDITVALDGLARTLMATGRLEGALPLLIRARENIESGQDPDDIASAWLYATLGKALAASGDHAGALDAWREASRTSSLNFPPNDPHAIATEMGLGLALWETGQPEEALKRLRQATSSARRFLLRGAAPNSLAQFCLETVEYMNWVRQDGIRKLLVPGRAAIAVAKGLKKAGVPEPMMNRIIGMHWLEPENGGPGVPEAFTTTLSRVLIPEGPDADPDGSDPQGPSGEAVLDARALLADRERDLGPGHEDTIRAWVALGNALLSERRIREAKASYVRARTAADKSLGPRSPAALGAWICLRLAYFLGTDSQPK
jgi:tetratricopeptide (TPR) repeat protein